MRVRQYLGAIFVVGLLAAAAYVSRESWRVWLVSANSREDHEDAAGAAVVGEPKMLELSAQARKNLNLVSQSIQLQTYWRTIETPGIIIDRPGTSDRAVVAPAAAVVTTIYAFPGDLVRPGDRLFTLRLIGEQAQATQAELIKTIHEMQFINEQRARLEDLRKTTPVPDLRFLELENQAKRLLAASRAYRQELLSRGLPQEQIDRVAEGKFVTEIEVKASVPPGPPDQAQAVSKKSAPLHEIEQLRVELGQQVTAGQVLCMIADHQELYIEGHSFKREAPLLERAAKMGWPVRVIFTEDQAEAWPPLPASFAIRHLSNTVDPASRTFSFYVPLANQSRTYETNGRTFRVWRFRPGQRVRLLVPVEEFPQVLVMPAAGVARVGADAYVFRQNGDLFERRAVHVLFEDREHVVLVNDGSVRPGLDYLAQGAAATLQRILKAQHATGGLPPGAHFHADGSLHIPGK